MFQLILYLGQKEYSWLVVSTYIAGSERKQHASPKRASCYGNQRKKCSRCHAGEPSFS